MVKQTAEFHLLTVGWGQSLIERLWNRIEEKSVIRFSHLIHPKYTREDLSEGFVRSNVHVFGVNCRQDVSEVDRQFLASLEQDGVPTIHNMIMGDRVVSKVNYVDALRYATSLAGRLNALFDEIRPSVIIGGFDSLHSSLAFAVAKKKNIPWFALNFSVIPSGFACFTDRMLPSSRVFLDPEESRDPESLAEETLLQFENRQIMAPAYMAPAPLRLFSQIRKLPQRVRALRRTIRKSRGREFLQFVEARSGHSVSAALRLLWQTGRARRALPRVQTLTEMPREPYVFFGLHFQPESSIDVWAPFYSNQLWVIELISRSLPPTHRLMVKIHKSDVSNYSRDQLQRMKALPGVELVAPDADTRSFIENADLVIAIQGTIGLEAALVGKPVIMLGDSPVTVFPSASRIGKIHDLPALIKNKLAAVAPSRRDVVDAFSAYLAPFLPASHNDWTKTPSAEDIDNFATLFDELRRHVLDTAKSERPI